MKPTTGRTKSTLNALILVPVYSSCIYPPIFPPVAQPSLGLETHSIQMAESIDQVIQNGKSYQQLAHDSAVSFNRTAPIPSQTANSGSPRRDTMSLRRSNSQVGMSERYGALSPRDARDGRTGGKASTRQSVEGNRGPRNGNANDNRSMAVEEGRRHGNGNNITDFFSPEVFQIVLHNPTTAHRFTKFCQSRACGENMEFLEKVCHVFLLCTCLWKRTYFAMQPHISSIVHLLKTLAP